MKKILSLILLCMCLCTCMVYAEDSKSTNVTFDIPTSYTWKAPASLELNEDSPVTGTVEVTENVIPEGSKLVISLATENNFTVTSDEGATRTYTIKKGESSVAAGDTIMEVAAGTNNASQALNFSVVSLASGKKAGTFKGTANFTANIKLPPAPLTGYSIVTDADSNGTVSKGDIIKLSDTLDMNADSIIDTFRVLSVDGSSVKLLAMDSYKSAIFGSNNTYSGSTLDTEMTNYYNALPESVKSAIVAQDINQLTYSRSTSSSASDVLHITALNSNNYYYTKTSTVNVGNRSVFALDIQDIADYLGSDTTGAQLNEMFFNSSTNVSRFVWLRSASAVNANNAFSVRGNYGHVNFDFSVDYSEYEVRPAFVINLG